MNLTTLYSHLEIRPLPEDPIDELKNIKHSLSEETQSFATKIIIIAHIDKRLREIKECISQIQMEGEVPPEIALKECIKLLEKQFLYFKKYSGLKRQEKVFTELYFQVSSDKNLSEVETDELPA